MDQSSLLQKAKIIKALAEYIVTESRKVIKILGHNSEQILLLFSAV
jgi:hypothetical protein